MEMLRISETDCRNCRHMRRLTAGDARAFFSNLRLCRSTLCKQSHHKLLSLDRKVRFTAIVLAH